ncbi:MAG: hypothetical protein ACRYFK_05875 [Janthinobacterium lividum]
MQRIEFFESQHGGGQLDAAGRVEILARLQVVAPGPGGVGPPYASRRMRIRLICKR